MLNTPLEKPENKNRAVQPTADAKHTPELANSFPFVLNYFKLKFCQVRVAKQNFVKLTVKFPPSGLNIIECFNISFSN
jgi:hypothetical protein